MRKVISALATLILIMTFVTPPHPVLAQTSTRTMTVDDNELSYFTYSGSWSFFSGSETVHNNTGHLSATTGDYWSFTFVGSSIELYAAKYNNRGICDVYLDDTLVTSWDGYSASLASDTIWSSGTIDYIEHTVKVVVTGTKNASSSNYYCISDWLTYEEDANAVDVITRLGTYPFDLNISGGGGSPVVDRQIAGNHTLMATTTATVDATCSAIDCPAAAMYVRVMNYDTEARTLYICKSVVAVDADQDTVVKDNNRSTSSWIQLPFAKCNTATVSASSNYDVSLAVNRLSGADGNESNWTIKIYLSWAPIQTCDQAVTTLTHDQFLLNSQIYDPVAQSADEQIYTTVAGNYYEIYLSGNGFSNDYSYDFSLTDTDISWDEGTTWLPLERYAGDCFESQGTITNKNRTGYFIQAESGTLMIRVRDGTSGAGYADNHTDTGDPMYYNIDQIIYAGSTALCESQYTYDSYSDSVGSVAVTSTNSNGVLANTEPLIVGDWYVVSWNHGEWQDNGGATQTAVEYSWYGSGNNFTDLGGTHTGSVWCVSSSGGEVLIQASDVNLYLRVNDGDSNFSNNTGTPYYDIYHATFSRTPESCETSIRTGSLIEHKTVDADQSNGLPFAQMVGGTIASIGLSPGAWYILETTDGPWWQSAMNPFERYDMAVSEDGSTWEPLADWNTPVCNVAIDTLGHRRVIFQMPDAGEISYSLRVNATGAFFINMGSMSWDLYGATQLQTTPGPGGCDYSYNESDVIAYGSFDGDNVNGVSLTGLTAGNIYAIKVLPDTTYLPVKEGWQENVIADNQNAFQISHNDGHQYYSVPDEYTAMLCYEELAPAGDGVLSGQLMYVQPGDNYNYKLRVASTTFSGNTGKMLYWVYGATPGQTVVNTCFDGLSLQSINDFDWLDVRDETGEVLSADTARYTEFVSLTPGTSYAIETPVGQGPWTSDADTAHWDVALSKDNGANWEAVSMDSTLIDCASQELIGHVWKAKFTVTEGDVWKIRVNDTAGAFADNGGNMAYKFYVLCSGMACTGSVPNDSTSNPIPAVSIQGGGDVCKIAVMRPGSLSLSELASVGNYFGAWLQYVNLSVLRYMAWCPKHTNMFFTFLDKFKTLEPLATVIEWQDNLASIKREMEAYDWGSGSGQDFSLFDVHSKSELNTIINERFMPSGDNSVWDRGQLISFGQGTDLPDAYYSCSSALTARLPNSLKTGVCFVSAYFIETSASFWIQMVLDIGAFFLIIGMLKGALQETIYMMTGVKPWTKSGANASVDKLAAYMERRDREDQIANEWRRRRA